MLLSQNTFTIKRLLKEPLTIELSPETLAIAADSSGVGNLSNAEFAVRVLKDGKELFPNCEEGVEGRNYLFNSGNFKDLSMWSVYTYCSASLYGNLIRVIAQDTSWARYCNKTLIPLTDSVQNFVVSIEYISVAEIVTLNSKNSDSLTVFNESGGAADGTFTHLQTQVLDGNRKRGIFKWATIIKGTALSSFLLIRIPANATVDIVNIKVEKGITATEWTPAPENLLNLATITTNKCTAVVIDNTVKITTLTPGNDAGWVDVEMAYGSLSAKKRFTWALAKSGVSISNIDVEYAVNTSTTVAPTTGWTTTAPAISGSQQLWTRTKTTYSTGSPTYSTPANITPQIGKGVVSIIEEYYLSTSKTTQTGGSWVTSPPAWSSGKYLWTRSKITYSNPTSTDYTTPVVSSEWEAVNDIEIGGRNYYLNTKTPFSVIGEYISNQITANPLHLIVNSNLQNNGFVVGDTVTLSYKWKATKTGASFGSGYFYIRLYNGITYFTLGGNVSVNDSSNSGVQNISFTLDATSLLLKDFTPRLVDIPTNVTLSFSELKLEKGNKATDWTPAPEDVDAKIDDIQVGGENIADRTDIQIAAGAENSKFEFIKGNLSSTPVSGSYLKNNQAHVLTISESIRTVGTATQYSVVLFDFTQQINTYQQEFAFSGTKRVIKFTTPATGNWSLLIYAGIAGATAGNTVEYKGIMLQEGNKETAYQLALRYLNEALMPDNITPVGTDIGLLFSKIIQMRDTLGNVHSGMSGLAGDNIGFWAGGTYADALADIAKIILRKDGSGQLAGGSLSWDLLGQLLFGKVGDSETIKISTGAIPDLAEINNREEYSLPVLNEQVIKDLNNPSHAGINVNTAYSQEFTVENDAYLSIDAAVMYAAGTDVVGFGTDGMIWLEKFNGTSWVTLEEGIWNQTSIYLNVYQYSVTKGRFRVRWDVVCGYNYVQGDSATIILNKSCEINYKLNVKKLVIGIDGIALFDSMSDKYLRLSLKDNVAQLRMKLDTDMPGVLLAGDGNASGGGIIRFGAKRHTSKTVEILGTGYYKVWHTIGHNLYTVQLTMKTAGMNGVWETPNNDYFIVRTYSGTSPANTNFSFAVFGDN